RIDLVPLSPCKERHRQGCVNGERHNFRGSGFSREAELKPDSQLRPFREFHPGALFSLVNLARVAVSASPATNASSTCRNIACAGEAAANSVMLERSFRSSGEPRICLIGRLECASITVAHSFSR